jgi:NAD(P)-dependent dehydrogenase (short-subunit alcohol dehydrogenase family)
MLSREIGQAGGPSCRYSIDKVQRFDLHGRVAVVMGAGSGFGHMFSTTLAAFGAEVPCLDRDLAAAQQTADLVLADGGTASAAFVDVADDASIQAFARQMTEASRCVDILINNAGIASAPNRVHEIEDSAWDRVIGISLNGTFRCTRAIMPLMLARGRGSIINLSSVMGLGGFYPGFPSVGASYAAAKAGIIGRTRQLAVEYAGDNIHCNVIAPGWHKDTNLGAERRSAASAETVQAFEQTIASLTPMGRKGTPEELRGLAVLLASDASSFITGQVFTQTAAGPARDGSSV